MASSNDLLLKIGTTTKGKDAAVLMNYFYCGKKTNKDGTIRWVCNFKGCNGSITSYNGIAVKLNGVAVFDINITEMVDSNKDKHAPYSDEQLIVKEPITI